jgi:hypothetical protein
MSFDSRQPRVPSSRPNRCRGSDADTSFVFVALPAKPEYSEQNRHICGFAIGHAEPGLNSSWTPVKTKQVEEPR